MVFIMCVIDSHESGTSQELFLSLGFFQAWLDMNLITQVPCCYSVLSPLGGILLYWIKIIIFMSCQMQHLDT